MAGKEFGFGKTGSWSLREYSARATLRRVWQQGHTYIDLREDGKSFVFFCTLCLSPCYSDTTLFDHLKGNLHSQRYASAKLTLFGPMPWPFNDGVLFFSGLSEQEPHLTVPNSNLSSHVDRSLNTNGHNLGKIRDVNDSDDCDTVIPGVLIKDKVSILRVKFIGFGHIGLRIRISDDCTTDGVSRIWCAWLGKEGNSDDRDMLSDVPDCDFAIVTFAYTYDLGRKGVVDYSNQLLSDSTCVQSENIMSTKKKRKKSFSDPEDISLALRSRCGSSGENCQASKALLVEKDQVDNGLTSGRYDSQIQHSGSISSKAARRELRRQHRLASEKMCDICQQKMLPGKDVATLFNKKTGSLTCSSRNMNGAFHVFHTSCLIHWLLLCEFEMWTDHSTNEKTGYGSTDHMLGGANRATCSEIQTGDIRRASKIHISSVFCPECQGTGINTEGDELEKPTVPLSEMFCYKIKAINAHKLWMKYPEVLQKCSTGLHFPCGSDENFQEKVLPLRLVHFYRADE